MVTLIGSFVVSLLTAQLDRLPEFDLLEHGWRVQC
jgi:hypothetical protein